MRLAWYAGASTASAALVFVAAFHQRANFYSAMVYLSQNNLCLLILVNLVFLVYGSFMYGLQRVCFGQLRPVEIEQLYEKAWFAVTETCLAMTIFREEVGGFFLVMFTGLVTGKVWGWISEGRVDVLEQQPPANPRLFHTRLSVSLVVSLIYDAWLLHYSVSTVIQQARPDMMVMFLFEFAILTVCSFHTALRYMIYLVDARISSRQTSQRLEERRRQIREQREEILRQRAMGLATEGDNGEEPPNEDDIDEMDIEVPGWESKGQWVLSLDLCADFLKLCTYATFFFVLLTFYGLPIHIMRDLFMTTRSFIKQLGALLRYRQALREMNKFPDATEEELSRENTCIICREEMHLWDGNDPTQIERYRPKKLPCGHILHFGCLKSWLERQQVCPTCRRSVVMADGPAPRNRDAMMFRVGLNLRGQAQDQNAAAQNGAAPGGQGGLDNAQQPPNGANGAGGAVGGGGNGIRMFNFGPLRVGFAQGGAGEMQDLAQRMGVAVDAANGAVPPAAVAPHPVQGTATGGTPSETILNELRTIERRIQQETIGLRFAEQEAQTLRILLTELQRIREVQAASAVAGAAPAPAVSPFAPWTGPHNGLPHQQVPFPPSHPLHPHHAAHQALHAQHMQQHLQPNLNPFVPRAGSPSVIRLGADTTTGAIPAGSPELPEGVVLPPGWTLTPLQRFDSNVAAAMPGAGRVQTPPVSVGHALQHQQLSQPGTSHQVPPSLTLGTTSVDAMARPTSNGTAATGQISQGDGLGASTSAPAREPAPMAQPIPVMPNWGGSAQMFGGPYGFQTPTPETNTPALQEEASSTFTLPAESTSAAEASGSSVAAEPACEGENDAADKGKGRAVTVEEADEE